ncbi:MAG: exodeoxyribonuclease VII large subunit [Candidatus Aenigmarchaeota archaeon]|nr:exodeoxyribonuclease VII large subunit [Candidatus Aenigmarchaeota archaeon]
MQNKIKWLSLAIAIIGIIGIWIVSAIAEPLAMQISEISEEDIGKYVAVEGYVAEKAESSDAFFLSLESEDSSLKVVAWKRSANLSAVEISSNVKVIGKIALYRGEIEIIADEVIEN